VYYIIQYIMLCLIHQQKLPRRKEFLGMKNIDIRLAITNKRLRNYEVAAACGVSEFTFSRWLREELPQEKKKHILNVIESL